MSGHGDGLEPGTRPYLWVEVDFPRMGKDIVPGRVVGKD